MPDITEVFMANEKELNRQPLTPLEHDLYLEQGRKNLTNYMQWHGDGFSKYDLSEYNMASANLYLNTFGSDTLGLRKLSSSKIGFFLSIISTEKIDSPSIFIISSKIGKVLSNPKPLFPEMLERLALSNELL